MTVRNLYAAALAACLGVTVTSPISAQQAAVGTTPNQQMADAVARTLNQSPQLKNFRVSVAYANGVAELSGTVADQGVSFHYFGGAQSVTAGTFTVIWAAPTAAIFSGTV